MAEMYLKFKWRKRIVDVSMPQERKGIAFKEPHKFIYSKNNNPWRMLNFARFKLFSFNSVINQNANYKTYVLHRI